MASCIIGRVLGQSVSSASDKSLPPNIVIAGGNPPHGEDTLRRIRIGQAELGYAKPAIRCAVTTVDQQRGTQCGPEPLTTLATYRRVGDGGIAFGAKFAVTTPGAIAVGDTVAVTTQAQSSDNTTG